MNRKHRRIGAAILLSGLIAQLPAMAATKPGYRLTIEAKAKRIASEDRVNVGETYKENFTARCYDSDGNEIDDAVYWSVDGEPTTGDAKAQWIPEVGRTFVPSVLKISTTTKTKPGIYPLKVVVHGEKCGTSDPIEYPLEVAPLLSGDTTIWWFDGANPSNYKTKGTLKAVPADVGPYTWKVVDGKDKVRFTDGSSSTTTDTETVKFKSTGPNGSKPTGKDVKLVVTVNGAESDPVFATVKVPHRLQPLSSTSDPEKDFGYVTIVAYTIMDQMNKQLPAAVELNEQFTTDVQNDHPNTNWIRGEAGGNLQDPAFMNDRITGQAWTATPAPLKPRTPPGTKKIHHFSGDWRIGSTTVGKGRKVQSNVWQRYQDHAAHEFVVSPAQR